MVQGGADSGAGVREGDVLAGKYRVERVLGVGGMGVVVAAHHIMLDEKVALKFLLPGAIANPEAVSRFVREARAATKIKNEHVARVTDVGELNNGAPYIVMEYLDGSDLAAWLSKRGAMPVDQAVDFVLQACEAIAEAHSLGIVHRDLKPANIFCVRKPDGTLSVKVLDFGISKITTPNAGGHQLTKTGAFMGSPLYMSPEQMKMSKSVDGRTDIWSLGVILYELVAGRAPFDAEGVTELAIKVAMEPVPPIRSFRADAPAPLEPVLARCLEKDRDRRYQTVGDLAVALQPFGSPRARISVEGILGTLRHAAPALPDRASAVAMTEAAPTRPSTGVGSAMAISEAPVSAGVPGRSWLGGTTAQPVASERATTTVPMNGGRGGLVVGISVAAVVLIAGGSFAARALMWSRPAAAADPGPSPAQASAAPARSGPPAAPTDSHAATPTSSATTAAIPTTASGILPVPSPASTHAAPSRPATSAPTKATPPPKVASPSPAVATPATNCDPPTWTDENGRVHLKKGCQ